MRCNRIKCWSIFLYRAVVMLLSFCCVTHFVCWSYVEQNETLRRQTCMFGNLFSKSMLSFCVLNMPQCPQMHTKLWERHCREGSFHCVALLYYRKLYGTFHQEFLSLFLIKYWSRNSLCYHSFIDTKNIFLFVFYCSTLIHSLLKTLKTIHRYRCSNLCFHHN